ncbi:hypothetical protein O7623_15270 [Solwaraspora sp. WMMD791]|uniref:hypothetical protein n=1 Tax=Solwaraspora sp. WMMD791 TaxID=3016086 RepID=UPI002499FAF2|nr:hypothetical protein [Solwaraspora sp. WMMD791]WFE30590.1 hypothetical protein O7623_15270 [Solwaraspora sp. WMMD791]
MATSLRNTALGIAGLTLAGGAIAAPALAAQHTPGVQAASTTVTASTTSAAASDSGSGVDSSTLIPHGVQGEQSRITLSGEQTDNVKGIIAATKKAGMDERAAVVAIATALQESKLENLGHLGDRNDHDSQGLFQQRPSSGWGTVEQITDVEYSTTAFLNGLKAVDGWQDMPLTEAAQTVQVSAYPFHYAQWETQAAELVAQHWNS